MNEPLADALRRTRSERGQTQRDVALELGVSLPTYHRLEAGSMPPSEAHLSGIAAYLDVPTADVSEMADDDASALASLRAELAATQRDVAELRERVSALEAQADRSSAD